MPLPPDLQNAVIAAKAVLVPAVFGVAAIAEDASGHVLLVRHSYAPGWRLPGGGVDRGEPPERAISRELLEEVGLESPDAPRLLGIHVRRLLWFTNVVAVYHLGNVTIAFRPNLEIREAGFFDPKKLPPGIAAATEQRLAEYYDGAARDPYW